MVILVLGAGAVGLLATTYPRALTSLRLLRQAVTVEGVVTEKLVTYESAGFLPFDMPVYVVRYAFPTTWGQIRSGEQIVTRRFYDRVEGQGAPVTVTMRADNSDTNVVDARLTFPGRMGWRVILAGLCLIGAYLTLLFGFFHRGSQGTKPPPTG